jgi:hypothetical protein
VQGATVTFQSTATGTPVPAYQWLFSATNLLSNQTNSVLTLTNVQPSQAGIYSLVASNAAGSITSAPALLTVWVPPAIAYQPTNATVAQGGNANFQSAATGTPAPIYQWFYNGTNQLTGQISGTLLLTNVQLSQAGIYTMLASNVAGSVTSSPALLTVLVPPAIASQPTNESVVQGGSVSFQIVAMGNPAPAYQWYFNGTNLLDGQIADTLQLTNVQLLQAGGYSVVAANAGGSATSAVAQLTVFVPPAITLQPTNVTVLQGNNGSFYVTATGIPDPAYQWYFNETNLLEGATGSTLILTNAQGWQMGGYLVVVTNIAGAATSTMAQLIVPLPPVISVSSLDAAAGAVAISLLSQPGLNYTLEYKDSLTDTNWVPVEPPVPGTGGLIFLLDTNAPPTSRFYRVSGD